MLPRVLGLIGCSVCGMLACVLWLGWLNSVGHALAAGLNGTSTVDRDLEPVIVTGVFPAAPVSHLFGYRQAEGGWVQIPLQVDEVAASGSYTSAEDGRMDANDEVVFMARDLGGRATTPITASTLPISSTWYEIEVIDPLSPTKRGWAYLVRSGALVATPSVDYADYMAASQRISATHYTLGWAASHSGLDHMTLFGGGNILDRTKLRVTIALAITLTEDSFPVPPLVLIKDGPVRVIVNRGGATTFAYGSFLRTVTPIDLTLLPPGTLNEVRLSTDLTNTTSNGTYYDENTQDGVTIDGIAETVPSTPFVSAWRQVSLDDGTTVQVVNLGALSGTLSRYYRDDGASVVDSADTGDQRAYGDSGIRVVSPTARLFSVESAQFILPGRQGNRGADFYAFFRNPLQVSAQVRGTFEIYLPLLMK